MALVVEDGTGKSDAESYSSVADADSYHANHSGSTDWSGATTETKERALRLATQWIDTTYHDRWDSLRWGDTQRLAWPRSGVVIDGIPYDPDELPRALLEATAELALKNVQGDTLFADMADEGVLSSQSVRVGPITESKTYAGGSRGVKKYRLVEAMLRPLLVAGTKVQRS